MSTRRNKYFEGYVGKNRDGEYFTLISKISYKEVYVRFKGYDNIVKTNNKNIARGCVRNPHKPSVRGVGYTGDVVTKESPTRHLKSYIKWSGMIRRCYSGEDKYKNWHDCSVEGDWLCYANFKEWYDGHGLDETIDYHLDKDILSKGNRMYSQDTCCLVPAELNVLLTNRKNYRGDFAVGVTLKDGKYVARISKEGHYHELGQFDNEVDAFLCYKKAKEDFIGHKADHYFALGLISAKVRNALYNYFIAFED